MANSTIRMAFLAASAISTTMPIWAKMLLSSPDRSSASTAPNRPAVTDNRAAMGIADQEEIGKHQREAEDEPGLARRRLLLIGSARPFVGVTGRQRRLGKLLH